MNKQDIIKRIEGHDTEALQEMHDSIMHNEQLAFNNTEFIQIIEDEMKKRQEKVDQLLSLEQEYTRLENTDESDLTAEVREQVRERKDEITTLLYNIKQ